MLNIGEAGPEGMVGGDVICCDVRRDGVLEEARRGDANGRGDGGTELRSGMVVACLGVVVAV